MALPANLDHHVRQAALALRQVICALDETRSREPEVAALKNVQERGLEPVLGYLDAALGILDPDDYDDDE